MEQYYSVHNRVIKPKFDVLLSFPGTRKITCLFFGAYSSCPEGYYAAIADICDKGGVFLLKENNFAAIKMKNLRNVLGSLVSEYLSLWSSWRENMSLFCSWLFFAGWKQQRETARRSVNMSRYSKIHNVGLLCTIYWNPDAYKMSVWAVKLFVWI